uniref:SERTA domain-containing protein n=1 Tax=Gadus morhua TaxID=8049 RepID=A0A8C4ZTD9_GADMO
MFPKGTKRKFSDSADDPAPEPATPLQRQSLLDMSLIKLQLCHMLVEPNLCRSVLIANTVRQIQEEMTQDGSWQLMTQALAAAQCPADRLVASELLCRQTDPAAAAGGPKPYALVGEAYQEEEEEEEDSEECASEGEEGEQVFGTFEIKHPPPGPDPALEELFSDVDASYYDLDTVLTGMQAAPKMGPYDLLESLSSHGRISSFHIIYYSMNTTEARTNP